MTARPMFNRSAARSVASRGLAGDPATCACGAALQFGTDGDGGVVEYCDACHRARRMPVRGARRHDQRARLDRDVAAAVAVAQAPPIHDARVRALRAHAGRGRARVYAHKAGITE